MKSLLNTLPCIFLLSILSFPCIAQDSLAHYSYHQLDSITHQLEITKRSKYILPYAIAALKKAEKAYGKTDTTYARALYKTGYAYQQLQQIEQAITYFQKALAIQKVKIPDNPNYATTVSDLGISYYYLMDFARVEGLWLEALEIRKKTLGLKHKQTAASFYNLGLLYTQMNQYPKAEKFYLQGLACRKDVFGEKHPQYVSSLIEVAQLYATMDKYHLAEETYLKALRLTEEISGKNQNDYVRTLVSLGMLYNQMGQFKKAEDYFLQSIKIQEEKDFEKSIDSYLGSLVNLGILYFDKAEYNKAEPLYIKSMNLIKTTFGETHPNYMGSLINLAGLYQSMGEYEKAKQLYMQALSEFKKQNLTHHPFYSNALNNLATLHQELENYTKAEEFILNALEINKELYGEKHTAYANSLAKLGEIYEGTENYPKAIEYYTKSKQITKEILGEQHFEYAISLLNLGKVYALTNENSKAEPLYIETIKILRAAQGLKYPRHLSSLNYLSELLVETKQYERAWDTIFSTIQINSNLVLPKIIDKNWIEALMKAEYASVDIMIRTLRIAYYLLEKEAKTNSKEQQSLIANLALFLLQRHKNDFIGEEEQLRTLSKSADWVLMNLKVLDKKKDVKKAFAIAEQNKSVLLLDEIHAQKAYSFGVLPDSLILQEKDLEKQHANTKAALTEKRPQNELDSIRSALNQLNFKIDAFKANIQKLYPKYSNLKYQQSFAQVEDIQKSLDDKTILLDFLIGDSILYAFCIGKQSSELHEILLSNEDLHRRVKELHEALSNYNLISNNKKVAYSKYTEHAYWFYKTLIAPIIPNNKAVEQLIIIPDDELGHLPFEAFLTKQAPQEETNYAKLDYLVGKYKISYNYSATLWKENKNSKNNTNNKQILALAADYNVRLDSTKSEQRLPIYTRLRSALSPLPATQKELDALADNFEGYFDKSASEKTFKEKAGDFGVIHLAMHGLLNQKEPIMSSLAFTEDGDSLENNFLQVYEISKMELHADLVVLSACETGYGRFEKGNGIASLARAFMYAGAPALIVSLWQVNDYATSEIMKNLYQNLANGMEKDEALRQAKIKYMQNAEGIFAHPAFWSPFILMGNTDAIYLKTKGGWFWWGVGGAIILLVGLFATVLLKKK